MKAKKLGTSDVVFFSTRNNHVIDPCVSVGRLATRIMEMRQDNVPLGDVVASLPQALRIGRSDEQVRAMIMEAFKQPAYITVENKNVAISDFMQSQMLQCYRSKC